MTFGNFFLLLISWNIAQVGCKVLQRDKETEKHKNKFKK